MSRRGDNIRKRKDGRWEGRYICGRNEKGRAVYRSVYGKTYADVKEKLLSCIKDDNDEFKRTTETVEDVAQKWLKEIKVYRKYSTYVKYEYIYNNHIRQYLSNTKIYSVTSDDCMELLARENISCDKNKTSLSTSTLNSIRNVLTQIIRYGTEDYSFKINDRMKILCNGKMTEAVQVFSKEEQNKLLDYLTTDVDGYKLGIIICMFTGIRLGEICALKSEDVNLSRRTITVNHTVQRIKIENLNSKTELVISSPKTVNSYRIIPICDFLFSILDKYMPDTIYVVNGSKLMEPRTYQYYFQRLLTNLSVETKKFHSLRHTFATNCIINGMEPKCLSEILGHSDIKTTLNKYVHPSMEQKMRQINSFSYDYGQINGHT